MALKNRRTQNRRRQQNKKRKSLRKNTRKNLKKKRQSRRRMRGGEWDAIFDKITQKNNEWGECGARSLNEKSEGDGSRGNEASGSVGGGAAESGGEEEKWEGQVFWGGGEELEDFMIRDEHIFITA
jgi:hypothetical protein